MKHTGNRDLNITCAAAMPFAKEVFSSLGNVRLIDGPAITPDDIRNTDILAVRSTTRIDRNLLQGSRVKFVGTATIGTDHMDTGYLEKSGIRWCYSPGCNANSVSEYLVSALLFLAAKKVFEPSGKTIGIIGVGNVGSRVCNKARALGLNILCNDPPRAEKEHGLGPEFVSLDVLLSKSDIVTMHVPFTRSGSYPTIQMADKAFFSKMKQGAIFANAARGGIVNSADLIGAMDSGRISHSIIDTWENEPFYDTSLLDMVDIGTPHIAGHSLEGKVEGTVMVYREACRFLGVEPQYDTNSLLPPPETSRLIPGGAADSDWEMLWKAVKTVYDITVDDHALRNGPADQRRADHFRALRKNYRTRREFRWTEVDASGVQPEIRKRLNNLGFNVTNGNTEPGGVLPGSNEKR